ncbi:hypothetical protein [Klebsiella pneumoniae]|uniref:hypothetical protein n=1 Tax=Klebsiella pneumoniae TaxID=573 RepID=UPI0027FB16A5|nr:hypothetical protein [Klebsiella pneumoniae]EKZ6514929.1 hypothetical protein [Klebsiella pneumoniae]EKZ6816651.1 hypothetical protein [Klebsiella pneumoniae]ELA2780208.1 hypothetical protein [Klebsiella pneumoniae]ELC9380450.1 hypothetical protein [Klebsiella pneumoniae]
MTKLTITDERITSVIERLEHYACNLKWTNVRGAQDLLTAADGLRELQERRKAAAKTITLPAPACTYADHSYPAYTKHQVLTMLESLGVTVVEEDV